MNRLWLCALLLTALLVGIGAAILRTADFEPPAHFQTGEAVIRSETPVQPRAEDSASLFEPPVRLHAGDAAIRVESPGYAAPCWADINGDGRPHLLVGQFRKGKIQVFPHLHAAEFAPGTWLQAEGNVAEVPGVW